MSNKLLKKIGQEYSKYTKSINEVIVKSRDILKYSKTVIFAIHRGELNVAQVAIKEAEKVIKSLSSAMSTNNGLDDEGAYKAALEEYAEAKLFLNYYIKGDISEIKEVKLDHDIYLGAISDLTGEIVRVCIALAVKRDLEAVVKHKKFCEDIVSSLAGFDLTSSLRSKYDAAKRNLYKIEEVIYDLSLS